MKAFVGHIHAVKRTDLGLGDAEKDPNYEVSIIAHSMGGMAAMMYMINARLEGYNHGLSKAVLLAPAGIHRDVGSFFLYVFLRPLTTGSRLCLLALQPHCSTTC